MGYKGYGCRHSSVREFVRASVKTKEWTGRVLNVSRSGALIELSGHFEEAVPISATFEGASASVNAVLTPKWVKSIPSGRTRIGAATDPDISNWVSTERQHYNSIERILSERFVSKSDLLTIARRELSNASSELIDWIEEYERVGERDRFLWGWVLAGVDLVAIPGGTEEDRRTAKAAKLLVALLDAVIDDVADGGAPYEDVNQLWEQLKGEASPSFNFGELSVVGHKIWAEIWKLLSPLPNFRTLRPFLRFDLEQVGQAMGYAALINSNLTAASDLENRMYQPHNMAMVAFGMIDLMVVPFDFEELGLFRQMIVQGQNMGRLGNALTTWEREHPIGDLSSQFFSRLSKLSGISLNTIATYDLAEVRCLANQYEVSHDLIREWRTQRNSLRKLATKVHSINMHDYVDGLENFLSFHLSSQGLK